MQFTRWRVRTTGGRPARIAAVAAASLTVAAIAGSSVLADPGQIHAKEDQARQVLAEISGLDSRLNRAVEAYNGATLRLAEIRSSYRANHRDLLLARANLRRAQRNLASYLVSLYTAEQRPSTLDVFIGASSLGEAIDRLDATSRIAAEEATVVKEVTQFRSTVAARERQLKPQRAEQASTVASLAEQRSAIEGQLAERQRLLASVKDEILKLQAQERARQAELARQAEARLAAEQAAATRRLQQTVVGPTAVLPVDDASGSSPSDVISVAPPSQYTGVVAIAMRYLGVPYVWGGASPSGFDCSGFSMYVYAQIGVSLPHYTGSHWQMGVPVSRDQLQPGDLVFFDGLGHEGIYIGGGQFIHAPHTGDVVKISSMDDAWYSSRFDCARRL